MTPGTTPPTGSGGDMPCPWRECQGGIVTTTQDPTTGLYNDAPCPICNGAMTVTQDEYESHMARMDLCPSCRRHMDDCYCREAPVDEADYVTRLVFRLRDELAEAARHGTYVSVSVHAELSGSSFDGLAACADKVNTVPTLGTGPSLRAATWTAGRDGMTAPASEITLVERRAA